MDHTGMAAHLTRSDCERFLKELYTHCHRWDW